MESAVLINSIWIASTFLLGFGFKRMGMPPMLGFLAAGFLVNGLGLTGGSLALDTISDLGIYLLLFTIGLKLDLKGLVRKEVWGGATAHALLTILFISLVLFGAGALGLVYLTSLDPLHVGIIGFALSFSSTVFAVKMLEEKGEMSALHGQISIGILIMQDLMAVFFLTMSKGELPSPWVILLPVFLFAVRPVLFYIVERAGHGELLPLSGFFVALVVGTTSFSLVGLKPDLGALIAGMLIGAHPRSYELSGSLYSIKDIFLVGFFFQVGLTGTPELSHFLIALGLVFLLPVKSFLYFLVLTRFHLRARTGFFATLALSNYSEFGLLVAAIAMSKGWLSTDWIIILALALTLSFLLAAPISSRANSLYERFEPFLRRFETDTKHPGDIEINLGPADTLIFGLGAFGSMAYDTTRERIGDKILGVDFDRKKVAEHKQVGRRVIWGDATDYDFWQKLDLNKIKLVMLAMTNHKANLLALEEVRRAGYTGPVTATARFEDQRLELEEAGAAAAYNIFSEAGAGYADHVCKNIGLVCKTEFVVPGTTIPNLREK